MRVRVAESTLTHDLLGYLRRCGCDVVHSSRDVLDVRLRQEVSLDAVLSLVRDHRCYGCGGTVADVLVSHGSALCHDCRDRAVVAGDPAERERAWAQMEMYAYLRVWRAQHPAAGLVVLDGPADSIAADPDRLL